MQLALTIFFLNALYISINTFRTVLVVKGQRILAPLVAIGEEFVYVIALATALKNINSPLNIAAYAIGFGVGIYIGILIEDRIALGYVNFEATISEDEYSDGIATKLRDYGYGLTTTRAEGRNGYRLVMNILVPRKAQRRLMQQVLELAPDAFILVTEPIQLSGGFWSKNVDKRYSNHKK